MRRAGVASTPTTKREVPDLWGQDPLCLGQWPCPGKEHCSLPTAREVVHTSRFRLELSLLRELLVRGDPLPSMDVVFVSLG